MWNTRWPCVYMHVHPAPAHARVHCTCTQQVWDALVVPWPAEATLPDLVRHLARERRLALDSLALQTAASDRMIAVYRRAAPVPPALERKPLLELIGEVGGRRPPPGALHPLEHVVLTTLDGRPVAAPRLVLSLMPPPPAAAAAAPPLAPPARADRRR